MKLLTPENWKSYELIDSGNYKKLEKFGEFILSRPEPQAVWDPSMREDEWSRMNNAAFVKKKEEGNKNFDSERGEWVLKKGMKEQWLMPYSYKGMELKFRLGLSSFKHVGIFPEQASNWDYIYDTVKAMPGKPKVLNLFAYTGGASIAAKAAGADVTHVDSVKQVITWSRENMEASQLTDIRWVVEDAMKFVQREVKRGNKYQGIILDPPAYGRGPTGEKWIIEEHLNQMLKYCAELLDNENYFFIINLYSIGFSALILETFTRQLFGDRKNFEIGELFLQDRFKKKLPLGVFSRFSSAKG
ncbi:class I SAM-dependent methyltransferase [Sporocytophaga myxococcoides]|uniref:class I SAM-dependent methyltransferase n=1 Tax=Sporocytophaga myxococcoides TaxID=153721 RepID=UPI000422F72C|nr:class I SAM-dependent methyltransferase [Sporocytophaga myxococcoides]